MLNSISWTTRKKIVVDRGEAEVKKPGIGDNFPPILVVVNKKNSDDVPELYDVNVSAVRRLTKELLLDAKIEYYDRAHPGDGTKDKGDPRKKNKLPDAGESSNHLGIYAHLFLLMSVGIMKKIPLKRKL